MKRLIAILLCMTLAFVLPGCGSDDPYVPTGDGLTWDEDYTGPTVATKPPQEQNLTLTYYPDRSMNPLICTDFTNRALFSLVYQSLFSVDRSYQPEPILCKQYSRSEDMKTYTFYLENATFSDGSALTAQDVVATLLAAKESKIYSGRFKHVKEIVAGSDGSVVITLNTAYENLPILLDVPILKQNQLQLDLPIGTGPYVLESAGNVSQLRRRTDWWCKADMTVTAASILLVHAQDAAQIRDEFEFNDLSLVCADPGSDRYADYRCDYELWDCENHIFLYLGCNMSSSVFSNAEVRSALVRAVDRDTLAASYYRGFARAASLPASPLSPYYNLTLASRYSYDGGEAFTTAINDAGLAGSSVMLLVNSDDSLRLRVARDIRDMLTASGLTVELLEYGSESYLYALRSGMYDLYLGQTKLSANMDLTAFFSSSGALNYGSISDVALYTLCTEALANYGNFYTLHQSVMNDGRICPILFRSYAVYATRGLLTSLTPSRDNVFYYSLGKTMEKALIENNTSG